MQTLTRFLLRLVAWLPLVALNAWALQTIWNWYLPFIFQLSNLEFSEAIGLSLILSYLTHQFRVNTDKKTENEQWIEFLTLFSLAILKPLACVGAAWIYLLLWPII